MELCIQDLMDNETFALLEKCDDLPSPPGVADQIIHLSSDANSDIDTLAEIVSFDPALTAKILRIANSSLYARRTKTENIQQAVVMFGWEGTLNLALSFSLVGNMKDSGDGLDYTYFWKRSLATAVACRCLAGATGYAKKEELFLPGLLQDIGMLAIDKVHPELYSGIRDKQQDHQSLIKFEKSKLGFDHAVVGAWLLNKWDIPDKITELVSASHGDNIESVSENNSTAAKCVAFAGILADCICFDHAGEGYLKEADKAEKEFDIDIIEFMNLIGTVTREFLETANMFDVEIDDPDILETVAEMAKMTLELSGTGTNTNQAA
ncbi:MAG: HDOD domain-containing protein [Gammaproteobacteria bacterium]|nr:MAG: HDOD domain-containing protein [Gammaproteobacteria bacterium]